MSREEFERAVFIAAVGGFAARPDLPVDSVSEWAAEVAEDAAKIYYDYKATQ